MASNTFVARTSEIANGRGWFHSGRIEAENRAGGAPLSTQLFSIQTDFAQRGAGKRLSKLPALRGFGISGRVDG